MSGLMHGTGDRGKARFKHGALTPIINSLRRVALGSVHWRKLGVLDMRDSTHRIDANHAPLRLRRQIQDFRVHERDRGSKAGCCAARALVPGSWARIGAGIGYSCWRSRTSTWSPRLPGRSGLARRLYLVDITGLCPADDVPQRAAGGTPSKPTSGHHGGNIR